jgi:hypothetical protein
MKDRRLILGVLLFSVLAGGCVLYNGSPYTPPPPSPPPPPAPTSFPAPGSVGASGTLKDVYPAGGVMTINTPTVLSNVKIHGGLDIYANTELHNVYVEQTGAWWGNVVVRNKATLLAEDCTIKPVKAATNVARGQDGVLDDGAGPVTIRRCEITETGKGALLGSNVIIEDSWLHGFTPFLDASTGTYVHKDSFMTMGGSHIRITRCRCEANLPSAFNATSNPFGFDSSTQTGAILLQPWGAIRDVVVEDSFLMGGYYAVRMEGTQTARGINGATSGLVFRDNVFGPPPAGGGYYTYMSGVGISQWTNNVQGTVTGEPTTKLVPAP